MLACAISIMAMTAAEPVASAIGVDRGGARGHIRGVTWWTATNLKASHTPVTQ